MIDEYAAEVSQLKKQISKNASVNINSAILKNKAVETAKKYFEYCHPYLSQRGVVPDGVPELSNLCQDLLRLTQGNNPKTSYVKNLSAIEKLLRSASIQDVSAPHKPSQIDARDQAIIETLDAIVPSAALSYRQVVTDLAIGTHKVSYRGTAAELRESLREILDHLAPDKEVSGQPNFKLEEKQTKPTMKQKVVYILKSRGVNDTKRSTTEKALDMVEEMMGLLARAIYNRASLSTHVGTTRTEVISIKRAIDLIFHEILEIP